MFCTLLHRKFRRKICLRIFFIVFPLSIYLWILFKRYDNDELQSKSSQIQLQHFSTDSKGIQVVVGHYLGDDNINGQGSNWSDGFQDVNMFDPKPNEGKNGQPVIIPSFLASRMRQLFRINRFNLMASDRIPLNRTLPDVRKKRCLKNIYNITGDHTVSVIIVFYNEAWSTLLRTVTSVINRSPRYLLNEIILVDDGSSRKFLKQPLDDYASRLAVPTYVIHSSERKGLIRSRLLGAQRAKGTILVFLDAHCECTIGWLESLVYHVSLNKTKVACPIIDIINDETFAYVRSFEKHVGAFNWDLHFRWYAADRTGQDIIQPFNTPVMAGGLFAINKEYFFEIGSYDDQMEIWGGENLELSFRIWQCGGSISIVPCSHVGHLFRKSSPYSFPGGVSKVLYSNLIRMALVWMDEWSEFYFKFHPETNKLKNHQNVDLRKKLRERLKCKNFKWFLGNIWPQRFIPMDDRFFGKIRNIATDTCLEKPTGKSFHNQPTGMASATKCTSNDDLFQMFVLTRYPGNNDTVSIATDESICLDVAKETNAKNKSKVHFTPCTTSEKQKWIYDSHDQLIKHWPSNLCIEIVSQEDSLILNNCTASANQKWKLDSVPWR